MRVLVSVKKKSYQSPNLFFPIQTLSFLAQVKQPSLCFRLASAVIGQIILYYRNNSTKFLLMKLLVMAKSRECEKASLLLWTEVHLGAYFWKQAYISLFKSLKKINPEIIQGTAKIFLMLFLDNMQQLKLDKIIIVLLLLLLLLLIIITI